MSPSVLITQVPSSGSFVRRRRIRSSSSLVMRSSQPSSPDSGPRTVIVTRCSSGAAVTVE